MLKDERVSMEISLFLRYKDSPTGPGGVPGKRSGAIDAEDLPDQAGMRYDVWL
jgi:hypothetical protein